MSTKSKSVLMVSFGPVATGSNGYFLRSKTIFDRRKDSGEDVSRLEFVSWKDANEVVAVRGVISVILRSYSTHVQSIVTKHLTFDPIYILFSQLQILIGLLRNKRLIAQSDEVIVEGALLPFAIVLARLLKKQVVLDTHAINVDVAGKIGKKSRTTGFLRKILWYPIEFVSLKLSSNIIAISERDKQIIESVYRINPERITVIGHKAAVKSGDYSSEAKEIRASMKLEREKVVLFVGDLGAIQNLDAVNFIVDELGPATSRHESVKYLIVGANPKSLKPRSDNVIFTGFVKSLEPYIEMADLCIAPLSVGGGVKTKMLDYIAFNKKILATPTATEGIETSDNNMLKVASLSRFKAELLNELAVR